MRELKVDHINLAVPNIDEAIDFYTNTMGFKLENEFSKNGLRFVFVTDGNLVYELLEKPVTVATMDHIAYISEDIEADYTHFKQLGLTTTEIGFVDFLFNNGVKYFFIRGTANERIEFCQRC